MSATRPKGYNLLQIRFELKNETSPRKELNSQERDGRTKRERERERERKREREKERDKQIKRKKW